MVERGSGILLHITCLPSSYGIGDLGPEAYQFADFLRQSRQRFWQILPLNPTNTASGNSPYSSHSAFAGNPLLISPEFLVEEEFLSSSDIDSSFPFQRNRVDYRAVSQYKGRILQLAYEKNKARIERDSGFERFCHEHSHWLDDYALFVVLKEHFDGRVWSEWPVDLRDRQDQWIREYEKTWYDQILAEKFFQYLIFKQWFSLRNYCNDRNIEIIGDVPIYVNYDSSDVWANPDIFKLDEEKRPTHVAGVPPDYFSTTGQLWGNPVYCWESLKEQGYQWWIRRMEHNLKLFDHVRLDHFRGFVAYWEVAADEETAVNGTWVEAPAKDFFDTLFGRFPRLPIIAEDLGTITPDVKEMIHQLGFPGMKVLLFAFGEDLPTNPYIPHCIFVNSIVYTGTHDNNTVKGWFEHDAGPEDRNRVFRYLGRELEADKLPWEMIRLAMMTVAHTVIIPMQDVLGLGEEMRMNLPATSEGNWEWRLLPEQVTPSLAQELREMTEIYGRIKATDSGAIL
jgi:4-alpha-glucanotransferase